jgi:hypothetical protein
MLCENTVPRGKPHIKQDPLLLHLTGHDIGEPASEVALESSLHIPPSLVWTSPYQLAPSS